MHKNPRMHDGHFRRIREKAMSVEPYDFDDTLLSEIVLQCVFKRTDTNEIAKALLAKYGTFLCMAKNAVPKDLKEIRGIGENSAEKLCALLRAMYSFRMVPGSAVIPTQPLYYNDLVQMLYRQFENLDYERFIMFILNNKDEIIFTGTLGEGEQDRLIINKKQVVDLAKRHNGASVVIAHNHPTGGFCPSIEDVKVTAEIFKMLDNENIILKDHLIVSTEGIFSFSASHLMKSIVYRIRNPQVSIIWDKN